MNVIKKGWAMFARIRRPKWVVLGIVWAGGV